MIESIPFGKGWSESRYAFSKSATAATKDALSRHPSKPEDLSIVHMPGGELKRFLSPSPAQKKIRQMLESQRVAMLEGRRPKTPRRVVDLKARKLGASTEAQAQAFLMISNRPNTEALVVSHDSKSAQILFGISKRFYRALPDEMRPPQKFWNGRAIVFDAPLHSSLAVDVVSEATGRSGTYRFLHISELAQWGAVASEALLALRNSMPTEPDCIEIVESTGFGQGGTFFEEYYRAKQVGEAIFCPWWEDPRYQLSPGVPPTQWTEFELAEAMKYNLSETQVAWMRYTLDSKTSAADPRTREAQFRQEYPGCEDDAFQGKARGVFESSLIALVGDQISESTRSLVLGTGVPGVSHDLLKGLKRVVDPGGPAYAYVIGVDPSEGLEGGDRAGVVVLNRVTGRVEAVMAGGHDTEQLGRAVADLGRFYNRAWVVVERNGPGHRVLSTLRAAGYPRIWSQREPWKRSADISPSLGWNTSRGSKMHAIGSVIARLRTGRIVIPFSEIREEMRTYLYDKNGRPGAVSGCHDDLISALIIASAAGDELGLQDPVLADQLRLVGVPAFSARRITHQDIDKLAYEQTGIAHWEDDDGAK